MKLSNEFISKYQDKTPNWGFAGLSEVVYYRCVVIDTPILCSDFVWRPAGELTEGDKIIGFDEELKEGKMNRFLREAEVTHNEIQKTNVMGIELESGEVLYATPEHRWLAKRNQQFEWIRTDELDYNPNGGTTILPKWSDVWEEDSSYASGYLGAAFDGEAALDKACGLKFVQCDNSMLKKVEKYLNDKNYKCTYAKRKKSPLGNKETFSISIYGREQIQRFFGQTKAERLKNNYIEYINSGDTIALRTPKEKYNKVVRVFAAGKKEVAVMSTSTKTHITAGYPSHNTYSRKKEDGSKERWWETVRRVVEAIMSVYEGRLGDEDVSKLAENMYDAIYNFKLVPSGRGFWALGTGIVKERGLVEALSSCAFISTEGIEDATPFEFMMDLSMLGVGLGFDTLGAENLIIQQPVVLQNNPLFVVPDSREGWVQAMAYVVNAFFKGEVYPDFDFSLIREKGAPIKVFGGICPGPQPLIELIDDLTKYLSNRVGGLLNPRDITDIFTIIGKSVVSGNVRRTALLALLPEEYVDLKDYEKYPERKSHGWLANHSIVGEKITDYGQVAKNAMKNGEPAVVWLDRAQKYGRFVDGESKHRDKATGVNACAEMNLESYEHCLLVEVVLSNIESLNEFVAVSKLAHLYGKAITEYLVQSRWEKSAEVISRNRRIGISLGGVAQFLGNAGEATLISWCDFAYEALREQDDLVSEMLDISKSIKLTTIKPSGTTSILSGSSPGAHLVLASDMIKRMRVANGLESLNKSLKESGVPYEDAVYETDTTVYTFPYNFGDDTLSYDNVDNPMHEQVRIAELLAYWWADNAISLTVIIPDGTEQKEVEDIIKNVKLKTISFLPQFTDMYKQMPLEKVDVGEYIPIQVVLNYDVNGHDDAQMEKFCKDDVCIIKDFNLQREE